MKAKPEALLPWMIRLDITLRRVFPSTINAESLHQVLAWELLHIAWRSFGSVYVLMEHTLTEGHTDRTEDAAILVRRLLEIYARLAFLTEPNTHPEVQALRSELKDMLDQLTAQRDVLKERPEAQRQGQHQELESRIREVRAALEDLVGEAKPRPSIFDILKSDFDLMLLWRYESDVAHLGVVGRGLQRQKLKFGIPATPERRMQVIETAIALMLGVAHRAAVLLELDNSFLEEFGEKFRNAVDLARSFDSSD